MTYLNTTSYSSIGPDHELAPLTPSPAFLLPTTVVDAEHVQWCKSNDFATRTLLSRTFCFWTPDLRVCFH